MHYACTIVKSLVKRTSKAWPNSKNFYDPRKLKGSLEARMPTLGNIAVDIFTTLSTRKSSSRALNVPESFFSLFKGGDAFCVTYF